MRRRKSCKRDRSRKNELLHSCIAKHLFVTAKRCGGAARPMLILAVRPGALTATAFGRERGKVLLACLQGGDLLRRCALEIHSEPQDGIVLTATPAVMFCATLAPS